MHETSKDPIQVMWDDMAMAIAQADTAWSRAENAVATLLEKLLGRSDDSIALHIYFTPGNTETRFKIVNAVAQVKMANADMPDDLLTEWNRAFKVLGKSKDVRNRIAHSEIQIKTQDRIGEKVHQIRLTALSFDIARKLKEPKPPQWPGLSINEVRATADRFLRLAYRIEEIGKYWQTYSLRWIRPPLPEIFARIVEHRIRQNVPLTGQTKPKHRPPASRPKPKGPKLSAKQRRHAALKKAKRVV
jgi:hypothetical protein